METRNLKGRKTLSRHSSQRSGYMLVATSLSLFFLLGVAGLAVDIGRMYITKAEAQAFADSAALYAATKLDGTSTGLTNAATAATSDNDKWRFDTSKFTSVNVSFSNSATGSFVTSPASASGYNYVQVYVTATLPMYLIRVFSGPSTTIAASAIAGSQSITSLSTGVFPFTPYSRATGYGTPEVGSGSDPFGYAAGHQYTLRWGAPGTNTNCGTDDASSTAPLASQGKYRGYCCVSESAASLRQAIEGLKTDSVTIGSTIVRDNGAKNTEMSAIGYRVALDSDTSSSTYSAYKSGGNGNGARVVVVPVNTGPQGQADVNVAGLAAFFLLNSSYYSGLGGNDSACAEYIGPWTEGVPFPAQSTGASYSSAYRLRLFK
jgi:Flp pilus assembly protein TadG